MTTKLTIRLRPPHPENLSLRRCDLNHAAAHMRSASPGQSSHVSSGFSNLRALFFGTEVALLAKRSEECKMIAIAVACAYRRSQ